MKATRLLKVVHLERGLRHERNKGMNTNVVAGLKEGNGANITFALRDSHFLVESAAYDSRKYKFDKKN